MQAPPARPLALRLLVAFIGAVLGSAYSLNKFVEAALQVRAWVGRALVIQLRWKPGSEES